MSNEGDKYCHFFAAHLVVYSIDTNVLYENMNDMHLCIVSIERSLLWLVLIVEDKYFGD